MIRFETSHGAFTVELFPNEAPITVENFLRYVDDGHFAGTIFHRIVPGFVIQGGGLTADFGNKQTRAPIRNEAKNGLKNTRGSLSMARTDSRMELKSNPAWNGNCWSSEAITAMAACGEICSRLTQRKSV